MKTHWGSRGSAPLILDLGTRWKWVVNSRPGGFTPRERGHDTHWIRDWMGPRSGMNAVTKRNNSCPWWESNSSRPTRSPVTVLFSYWRGWGKSWKSDYNRYHTRGLCFSVERVFRKPRQKSAEMHRSTVCVPVGRSLKTRTVPNTVTQDKKTH
jgi:hypothetical protein